MLRKKKVPQLGPGCADDRRAVSYVRRQERKFEFDVDTAARLREGVARNLPLFEFYRGFPRTRVTTVYYDTHDRSFYRRAEESYDDNVKFRVKEYTYRGHDEAVLSLPHVFVELKQRSRGTVHKRRIPLPKTDLCRLLRGEDVWSAVVDLSGLDRSPPLKDAYADLKDAYSRLRSYLSRYEVAGTSIVSYRRTVYQNTEAELRVTFDDEIAVYDVDAARVNGELYKRSESLTPEYLGEPRSRYRKVILEVKCPSLEYPSWLQEALKHHYSKRLSKFTTSVRFLTDGDSGARSGGSG